jgi:hypothetical protein
MVGLAALDVAFGFLRTLALGDLAVAIGAAQGTDPGGRVLGNLSAGLLQGPRFGVSVRVVFHQSTMSPNRTVSEQSDAGLEGLSMEMPGKLPAQCVSERRWRNGPAGRRGACRMPSRAIGARFGRIRRAVVERTAAHRVARRGTARHYGGVGIWTGRYYSGAM